MELINGVHSCGWTDWNEARKGASGGRGRGWIVGMSSAYGRVDGGKELEGSYSRREEGPCVGIGRGVHRYRVKVASVVSRLIS